MSRRNQIVLLVAFCLLSGSLSAAEPVRVEANTVAEITFIAKGNQSDPFNETILDVIFSEPGGKTLRVPAFWAGGSTWRVRYASTHVGKHHYRSECNIKTDSGLHGVEGAVEVAPYRGQNPLFKHGPMRVAADHRHFEYADGTPFFWLGDTWWMGLCHRLQWPDEFKTLAADRAAKGFNVVQIVAGLYPDMPPFDPRGANEAGFPWETNYARIRPEYFDAADRRLGHLVNSGMTPCLVGAWGYFLPWMGVEKAKQHWRYLIARYGAYPVVWCAAGEANLPYYLVKGFPYDDREQVNGWTKVMRYIRETDPFHRPLSIHPTGLGRLSARGAVEEESLLDFDMLQTGHGMRDTLAPTVKTLRESCAATPVMPVLDSEVCFEMLGDNIPAEIPRLMFWACALSGAAGHTYGANGIWQCNRPGDPHGASPHGGSYGKIPWNEAMTLPGSQQVGWGKQFLERLDWPRFDPHPDWVAWTDRAEPPAWGAWIWFPEGDPKQDAPAEARFFRRTFALPEGAKIKQARLYLSADDRFEAWLNGKRVGSGEDWRTAQQFEVGRLLRPERNVLAVRAENAPVPPGAKNPAGLMASLAVELEDHRNFSLASDSEWRCSKTFSPASTSSSFDDSAWPQAAVLAKYGDGPWGRIAGKDELIVPFAAGIDDRVLVVYAPDPLSVMINHLRPGATYRMTRFDPVTGERGQVANVQSGTHGDLVVSPTLSDHDWVIALELKER